jgi:protein-L-isoaspartate(D-aspartate) O-methyltransferase
MVAEQLKARGIKDARVLEAMGEIPRERFVDAAQEPQAYEDRPLPIGHGQTISQPYIVALMSELARLGPTDRVLEVGAGCGYATAVLARLARSVYSLEIIEDLADRARRNLRALGILNAEVASGDGGTGWSEHAPFDAIVVWAGAPRVPVLLLAQLADGGRLVAPVGERETQRLTVVTRRGDEFQVDAGTAVRFVDMTGRYGWGGWRPEA